MNKDISEKFSEYTKYYFQALKFYDLRSVWISRFVFIILVVIQIIAQLVIGFSNDLQKSMNSNQLVIIFLTNCIYEIVISVYLYSYISELKNKTYKASEVLVFIFRNLFKILFVYLAYILFFVAGLFIFIIPGFIFLIMLIFSKYYVIDKGYRTFVAMTSSVLLTRGKKIELFLVLMTFWIIMVSFMVLFVAFFDFFNHLLATIVLASFAMTIVRIVFYRFLAILYVKLEYGI